MRLTDLNPEWVWQGGDRVGMTFNCPAHSKRVPPCLLHVRFKRSIEGRLVILSAEGQQWETAGETFETLSLWPPIEFSVLDAKGVLQKHWHGVVENGDVRQAQ